MNLQLVWENLVAYSMQIGLLVGLAAFIPAALRLRLPASRLAYWHILLAACLLLPAVRPWKQAVITLTAYVPAAIPAHAPSQPLPPPAMPLTEIALMLLGAGMVIRLGWLAAGFWHLARLRRHSRPLRPYSSWSVEADIRVSDAIASPVTFGLLRPAVLLPANFSELDASVQEAILCHEILHVRRRDWLFTLCEELVRSVFWFHPAIWWLLGEIGLAREQVVDRQVVELTKSRDGYLDALLAIAGAKPRLDLAPAPLFLRKRHLRQRVASIMKEVRMSQTRSISSLAAGLGILALACWFVTATFPLAAAPQMVADGPGVTVDTGGAVMHRGSIVYPEAARAKRIQGVVTVEATVDSSGNVVDTRVLSGPVELRRAAQQSVLQWHFAMDSSVATRQVKVNFDLSALPQAPAVSTTTTTSVDAAGRAVPVDRTFVTMSDGQQTTVRMSSVPKGSGLPATDGKRLVRISTFGLTDAARNDLLSRLPVHEGDILGADSLERVRKAMLEFDEHMTLGTGFQSNGEVAIVLSVTGVYASGGVIGGIIGGVPGGVIGGVQGGVTGSATSVPPAADGTKRITIGGNVQQAKLVRQPKPVYPPLAKQARISGVVRLQAVIGKEGDVINLAVISGHPLLIPSALESVRQWVYQKTLLNGEPVEVQTQIDVNYTLSEDPPIQQ
ncbi:MAG: M56 family metallopeptidase [Candidatus Solibacter sp.]|nr:M56 family metallopeptidase [Candidatus Solibacter sp.]